MWAFFTIMNLDKLVIFKFNESVFNTLLMKQSIEWIQILFFCFHSRAVQNIPQLIHCCKLIHQQDRRKKQTEAFSVCGAAAQAHNHRSCIFNVLSVLIYHSVIEWLELGKQTAAVKSRKKQVTDAEIASICKLITNRQNLIWIWSKWVLVQLISVLEGVTHCLHSQPSSNLSWVL